MKSKMLKYGAILGPIVILFMFLAHKKVQNVREFVTNTELWGERKSTFKPMPPLNESELEQIQMCVRNFKHAKGDGLNMQRKAHTYLTERSLVIEVGGNIGDDANFIINTFKLNQYIVLEPVERLYRGLMDRFRNHSSVLVLNFGLGKENAIYNVHLKGKTHFDRTSLYNREVKNNEGGEKIRIVNATEFFISIGAGLSEVDLITMNCEGCEYDLLDILTESTLVSQFRHIQFQPHMQYQGVGDVVSRYCRIQQRLSRTHILDYKIVFGWEMWRRNDVKHSPV